MTFSEELLLVVSITHLALGLWVLARNPRHAVNRSFFLFALGAAGFVSGIALLYLTHDFLFDKLAWTGCTIMLAGLLLLAHTFPDRDRVARGFWLLLLPLGFNALCIPFDVLIRSITVDSEGYIQPVNGPLLPLFLFNSLLYAALAVALFLRNRDRAHGIARIRHTYLMAGVMTFVFTFVIFDAILPFFGIYKFNLLGPVASIVFAAATAYAIIRHQLLDIRVIVQRGLIYTVLLAFVIGCYIAVMQVLHYLLGMWGDAVTIASAVLTTAFGIMSAPWIEARFRKLTDPIFFKDRYEYAAALHLLSSVLHANIRFEDLVRESETALRSILRTADVRIRLGACDAGDGAAAVLSIPIMLESESIGCIHLGEKRSGDPYTPEDLQLLRTFAYQAATALARAGLHAKAQRHAQELEAKVSERTRELEEAHERERQMINDLSHTLQTPLTILQTKLDRLKPRLSDDAEVRSLEHSLRGFSGLIYDLLALARLEGARPSPSAPFSLSELVADIAEEIDTIASAVGIEVSIRIAPNVYVSGDERRLREALMNIASNAVKYQREEGRRSITLTLEADDGFARIAVQDSGIGIAPEDVPHIFDRFYRGNGKARMQSGTGLGLAIAKRIIEQHDGTIEARSEPGSGTTVIVTLPLR
ncbi:MAG: ATP-binding protein [Patescibacteria group bacterium]